MLIYKPSLAIPYFFFRVFFSWFFVFLYCLSSSELQLLVYFLFDYYQPVTRIIYYIDYAYCIQGPSFKTKQYSSSLFLITAWILSNLQLISSGVANKPHLFSILSSPSTILFKRRLIVLAISSVIISLSTLRRVTGASPVISLRSTKAS